MTKKVKWIVITAVLLLVVIGVGFAIDAIVWNNINNEIYFNDYYDDRVYAELKYEHRDKVNNQEYVKEDFDVDNIDRIEYCSSVIIFYLKKGGIRNCKKAILELRNLDEVAWVDFVSVDRRW
ncbi:MAG: hypothetical protein MR909_03420 [Clostridiales bacterium]|nr:hypothetical protein [Clostridiales bacterium]